MSAQSPFFLNYDEVAEILRVSPKTLRNKQANGSLPFKSHLVLGKRLVLKADVLSFVDSFSSPSAIPEPIKQHPLPSELPRRKRGRPTKADSIARKQQQRDPRTVDFITGKTDLEVRNA